MSLQPYGKTFRSIRCEAFRYILGLHLMCCYELFAHWKNFWDLISFKTILKHKQAKLGPHPSFHPSFLLFVRPSIHTSVHPSISPGVFLELCHWFFLIFGMVLESHVKLCVRQPDFPGKLFLPPNWEMVFSIYWEIW